MEIEKFLRFLADSRVSRIQFQKRVQEGYFNKYPDRKDMFEQANKSDVDKFIRQNPEAIGVLKALELKANQNMKTAIESGNEEIAESDRFILDDIKFILDSTSFDKGSDISIQFDNQNYQIIKIISEARCCALYEGVLEGSKHISPLLKLATPELIQKSLKIAKKIDNCAFPKRNISNSLDLEIFKVGVSVPKDTPDEPEGR